MDPEEKHAHRLTPEEVGELEKADRLDLEGKFEAALGAIEETEEEAARVISRRGEAILDLFASVPPDVINRQLTAENSAFAATFKLGVSKLGALDIAGRWYREAAVAFTMGDYAKALSSFITAGTADKITPGIEEARENFRKKRGWEMTLADFLDRYPYQWQRGDPERNISILDAAAKNNQILPEKKSFFDLLLQKLQREEAPAELPSALSSAFFKGELAVMYSAPEALAMAQVKTAANRKPRNMAEISLLVSTPSEVNYWLRVMESGYFPNVGTPELQLFYTSLVQLAANNPYKAAGDSVNPFAYIPLVEYGEMNRTPENMKKYPFPLYTARIMATPAEQTAENKRVERNLVKLRGNIRKSGTVLKHIESDFPGNIGTPTSIIGNVKIVKINGIEYIVVEFLQSAADALTASGYLTMFDPALLRIDKRNYSAFPIGIEMTYHANYDKNVERGIDNRLSVKTLIEKGKLPDLDHLKATGQRNWKDKILKPLEAALEELLKVDFLTGWRYIDPRTQKIISRKTAASLPYELWENLRVEYDLARRQDETRLKSRIAEREEAKKAKEEADRKQPDRQKSSGKKSGQAKKESFM